MWEHVNKQTLKGYFYEHKPFQLRLILFFFHRGSFSHILLNNGRHALLSLNFSLKGISRYTSTKLPTLQPQRITRISPLVTSLTRSIQDLAKLTYNNINSFKFKMESSLTSRSTSVSSYIEGSVYTCSHLPRYTLLAYPKIGP